MPALNSISLLINTALQKGHFSSRRFNPTSFNAIADPMKVVEEKDGQTIEYTIPTIINNDGEGTQIVFDDKYSAQGYHRIIMPAYSAPDPAYGKPGKDIQEIADMKFVFMGDRSQMKVRQEEVIAAAVYDFPKEFLPSEYKPLGLTSCVIEMGTVEQNMYEVFVSEWNGRDYDLTTSSILFAINYRIVSTYSKCLSICN